MGQWLGARRVLAAAVGDTIFVLFFFLEGAGGSTFLSCHTRGCEAKAAHGWQFDWGAIVLG